VKDGNETGLGGSIVYIDTNQNGVRDVATSPTEIPSTDVPQPITDFSTINSQVQFDGLGSVFNVTVTLDITHSFVGDLDAYLISPSGRQVELFTEVGGQYNDFHDLTLDDSASRSISTLDADDLPYTGSWRPEGLLSDFIGEDAGGTWTLQIRDTAFADQGTLNSWSLQISSGEIYRTTDQDGNYEFDNLPAGDYSVRQDLQPGFLPVDPAVTSIPGADWANSQWGVSIVAIDDPNDPDGPDSHRNVKNVDFSNQALQILPGDFDRNGAVDGSDYVVWRMQAGTTVADPFSGADANGDGTVDAADLAIWRSHFGDVIDDYGNNAPAASHIASVPGSKQGVIEVGGDVDWFSFEAVAGTTYDLSTTLGTLTDTKLRLIDTDGVTEIAQNDNANGLASEIQWTPTVSGTYYAEVSGANSLTGSYDLTVDTTNDDHGNFAATATPIAVPSTSGGVIETAGDLDWFSFTAVMGTQYEFATTLLTLADSQLQVVDTDGVSQLAFDDDSGPGPASLIDWTAPASGTYYVVVNGFSADTGAYSLSASTVGPGSGAVLSLASASSFESLGSSSALTSADPIPAIAISSPISASSASSTNSVVGIAFEELGSTPLTTNGKHGALAAGSAPSEASSDAALLAWVQSLGSVPSSNVSDQGIVRSDDGGDEFVSSVDSIFDRIGAAAVAEGCAV
jgi:subtilisin-like proprotein convertase family protein